MTSTADHVESFIRSASTENQRAVRDEIVRLRDAAEVLKRHAVPDETSSIEDAVTMCRRMDADEAARQADPESCAADTAANERFWTTIEAMRENRGAGNRRSWQARCETAEATNVRLVMQRDEARAETGAAVLAEREACARFAERRAEEIEHERADAYRMEDEDTHAALGWSHNEACRIADGIRARLPAPSPTTAPAHG